MDDSSRRGLDQKLLKRLTVGTCSGGGVCPPFEHITARPLLSSIFLFENTTPINQNKKVKIKEHRAG